MYKAFQTSELVRFVKPNGTSLRRHERLNVRMFSSEYPPCWGGVGKHVQHLCRGLQQFVDLQLVTATYGRPDEAFGVTNLARVRVQSFPLLLAQYLAGVSIRGTRDGTLAHVHVPTAFVPRGAERVVTTFHVVWGDYSEALQHQKPMSLFDLQIPAWNLRLLQNEKRLAGLSERIIAVSHSVKKQLIEHYGVPPERVRVIHNGVDLERYFPSTKRRNLILYIGRQTAHKGLPYLLRGFAEFIRTHKDYSLVMVGERLEGGIDPSLIRLSETLGIRDKVKFTGRLPDREVKKILSTARCLVLPSLAEAFGMTVLEGMAAGTPVIATNVGGIPEVLQDGWNGLLVPPADPASLANSIDRLVSDPKLSRTLTANGMKTCEQFTWEQTARKTLEVYEQVCS